MKKLKQLPSQKTVIKPAVRIMLISGSVFLIAFALFFGLGNFGVSEKALAGLGMHGAKTINSTNVILNEFTALNADAASGTNAITVVSSSLNANSRFSGNLAAGELVMIIQMQGATLNTSGSSAWGTVSAYNNAGKFEFNQVASVPNATTINLSFALKNSYTKTGKVQVIRIPRYSTFTINTGASVTTQDWDGTTGGVFAVEVNGATIINGTVDVSGKGFRGGVVQQASTCCNHGSNASTYATTTSSTAAEKGEGIGGGTTVYDGLGGRYGRGAAANGGGGGNSHNASGGGGANSGSLAGWNGFGNPDTSVSSWKAAWDLDGATATFHKNVSSGGGRGGYGYSNSHMIAQSVAPGQSSWTGDYRPNVGGLGGRPLDNSGNRIFMGGGGGAGDSNNSTGTSGADGGGIVYILSGSTISGTGTINANGNNVPNSVGTLTDGDGSGGGGGGGSVVLYTQGSAISNLTINCKGGIGGSQVITFLEAEGAGGGGAGGYIATTNANSLTRSVSGGNNGTSNSPAVVEFIPNGATKGGPGVIVLGPANAYSGVTPLPVELVSFSANEKDNIIKLTWTTASEINNDYFTLEKSSNGFDYSLLEKIHGAGNSNTELTYSIEDNKPLNGENYYRLTQTDFDGKLETFLPVHVKANLKNESNALLSISPVPFTDHIKINYSTKEEGHVKFSIINVQGATIFSKNVISQPGNNYCDIENISDFASGIYFIEMKTETDACSMKIMKK